MKTTPKASTAPKAAVKKAAVPAAKQAKKPAATKKAVRKRSTVPPVSPGAPEVAEEVTHEEIATRAYFIYISAGCPEGQEMQHWLEAEAQTRLAR
jgi:hypothetical protein|uniref:DUF2934 domain-containing protein n=1 Tax=Prosthecobacter sp. TaxID=1965333 RepID=UPI00378485AD